MSTGRLLRAVTIHRAGATQCAGKAKAKGGTAAAVYQLCGGWPPPRDGNCVEPDGLATMLRSRLRTGRSEGAQP